ncbi:uncharacterized protein clmna [Vanacampus margaritifer]
MAGHNWTDWFEREEFIGQISDMRVQNLQVEREVVQKRTFTRWMNLHLEKCNPPIEVQDLFQDIQDGRILMALLEELSGCKLLHGFKKSPHRIFRLNNIAKVLSFLEERNVKLVSIDAADVVDGNSSIILGLIWNIILFFQIKELTGTIRSQFPSTSSLSSIPTSSNLSNCNTSLTRGHMATTTTKEHSKAFKKLLQWVQKQTRKYGVAIQDFGKSWTSGLAFLAVIKSIDPSLVDMRKALLRSARENLEDAFRIAHYSLGIPHILEPEDVTISTPDEQSIITYISQFLQHFPGIEEQREPLPLIERSISMERLNFSNHDTHHLGNSVHSSSVRERCIMFQMDCAQPPPKILFSFVSEDRGGSSPSIQPAISRTWFSEDSLADSTCMEENLYSTDDNAKEPSEEVLTNNSLQLTHSQSLFDPTLPELVKMDSVMDDSAISSPDSWVESDDAVVPMKCCESQSDSSLCDCTTLWDMYCATHVPITSVDEGSVPITCEVPDDQSITESCIDEGIFPLNSVDDTQGNILAKQIEKRESDYKEVAEKKTEDFFPKPLKKFAVVNAHKKKDGQVCPVGEPPVKRLLSFGSDYQESDNATLSHAYPQTESQYCSTQEYSESFSATTCTYEEQTCLTQAIDPVRDSQINEKDIDYQTVKGVEMENEYKIDCQYMGANNFMKDEVSLIVHCDTDNCVSCRKDYLKVESDKTTQVRCFTKIEPKPYSYSYEQVFVKQTADHATDSQVYKGQSDCQISFIGVNVDTVFQLEEECSLQERRKEGVTEKQNEAIDGGKICWPDNQATLKSENPYGDPKLTDQIASYPVNTEDMSSATQAAGHQDDPPQKTFDSDNLPSQGQNIDLFYEPLGTSREINDFSTDLSQATEFIEPMDLFYPCKEEALFKEPLDKKMQSRPSALCVSALEPAPAYEAVPEDQPLYRMDEDFVVKLLNENSKVMTLIEQKTYSTSECKEQCMLPGGQIRGFTGSVFPADCSDQSEAHQDTQYSSREYTKSMRDGTSQNETLNPLVLRQRKGINFSQSQNTQTTMRVFSRKSNNGDSEFCWSGSWEPYLLFVLWLLLYCLWLLPQMDLKTLPSLLFNINH